jgi:hypothetical protein
LESSQRLRDMKYISFKHQRENKQNSDIQLYYGSRKNLIALQYITK